jgi:4-phytase / acid phosphatase
MRCSPLFRSLRFAASLLIAASGIVAAQTQNRPLTDSNNPGAADLKFVVMISRHGVRSPTSKTDQLNRYTQRPWPAWTVPPGYLTEHGAHLMTLFGAYDREKLAAQGLLSFSGCGDAKQIKILADSDQRTRETGKALAAGLAPGCALHVQALAEGTPDPLFHALEAGVGTPDKKLAVAAVAGRIGGSPDAMTEAFRPQLQALENVLSDCGGGDCTKETSKPAQSLFDVPASLTPGKGDHLVELHWPLGTAATMAENLLLEYTEGMDAANVGWGRVDLNKLRELIQLHTASEEISGRTEYIARVQSSNLLFHLLASMVQATKGTSVPGALTEPSDRLLILVGHDTNLANISGALHLRWLIDGRVDDTPPGGALVFEIWKQRDFPSYSVRAYYTAQTLEQMRNATPLTLASPPAIAPVFIPGCGQADGSCPWDAFQQALQNGIDSKFVK